MTKKYSLFLIILLLLTTGCSNNKPKPNEPRDHADAIVEDMLQALNNDDYRQFSQYFDQPMRRTLPEETFTTITPSIKTNIGDYLSKEYCETEENAPYFIVHYKAKFSLEPEDAIIRCILSQADGKTFVSGFWLDSPRLRAETK